MHNSPSSATLDSELPVKRTIFTQPHFNVEFAEIPKRKRGYPERIKKAISDRWEARKIASKVLKFFPIVDMARNYDVKRDLFADLLTGLTVAIFHVPQSFGYCLLARVEPIYGLYTALFPMIMYTVFGTSRHCSIGQFAVVSMMTGTVVEQYKSEFGAIQVASTLAFLVGIYQLIFGAMNLGVLNVFLSSQLVSGFTAGVSVHIGSSQLGSLFGYEVGHYSGPFTLIKLYTDFFGKIGETHLPTLALSSISVVIMLLVKIFLDPAIMKKAGIPFPIEMVLVIIGTVISKQMDLKSQHLSVIETIPQVIPGPTLPLLSPDLISKVAAPALAMAVVSFSITVSLGRIFGQNHFYHINPNQEFIGLGAANLFGSFFTCTPVGASVPRSSIQEGAGGRTQLVSLINSALITVMLIYVGHYLEQLPVAILAAIIFVSLKKIFLQIKDLTNFWNISRIDGHVWIVSFLSTVIIDVELGLVIGIVFSLLTLIYKVQRPKCCILGAIPGTDFFMPLKSYEVATEVQGIKVFHFGGPLHFANSDYFKTELQRKTGVNVRKVLNLRKKELKDSTSNETLVSQNSDKKLEARQDSVERGSIESSSMGSSKISITDLASLPSHIILDFSRVTFVDGSSMSVLKSTIKEYKKINISFHISSVSTPVFSMLRKAGILDEVPDEQFFPSVHDAVMKILENENSLKD